MARPLRLEFAGALYHVTARGNERRNIFLGNIDDDRAAFLVVLTSTCERFNWICHAYCLIRSVPHRRLQHAGHRGVFRHQPHDGQSRSEKQQGEYFDRGRCDL